MDVLTTLFFASPAVCVSDMISSRRRPRRVGSRVGGVARYQRSLPVGEGHWQGIREGLLVSLEAGGTMDGRMRLEANASSQGREGARPQPRPAR